MVSSFFYGVKKNKFIKTVAHFLGRVIILGFIIAFYKCPIRYFFNINCPGCGMTRALLSALKLDFKAAFYYHPLFLPIGIVFFYFLFYDFIKKIRFFQKLDRVESIVFFISLILLLIVWIYRQFII